MFISRQFMSSKSDSVAQRAPSHFPKNILYKTISTLTLVSFVKISIINSNIKLCAIFVGDKPFSCKVCAFKTGDHSALARHKKKFLHLEATKN